MTQTSWLLLACAVVGGLIISLFVWMLMTWPKEPKMTFREFVKGIRF